MSDRKEVPREPTPAMLDAIGRLPEISPASAWWRAMYDAAPIAERTNVALSNAELDSIEAWLRNLPDYENEFAYRPKGTIDAADAIRSLRAQAAERDAEIERLRQEGMDEVDRRYAAEHRITLGDAARKDAERYRWLRAAAQVDNSTLLYAKLAGPRLDEAIDAAIASKREPAP